MEGLGPSKVALWATSPEHSNKKNKTNKKLTKKADKTKQIRRVEGHLTLKPSKRNQKKNPKREKTRKKSKIPPKMRKYSASFLFVQKNLV